MSAAGAGRSAATCGLAVVVVNYASSRLMERTLAAVDWSSVPAEVVVVDNFSTREERDAVTALAARRGWQVVAQPDNPGFGAGVNVGVRTALDAGANAVLLVNPDVSLDATTARALLMRARTDPMTMVAPTIRRPDGRLWFAGGQLDLANGLPLRDPQGWQDGPGAWLTGACLAVSAQMWRLLGGFDERYFMYWEDVELSHRCHRAGGRLVVANDLEVTHDVGATQRSDSAAVRKSPLYYRYTTRNRLLFAAEHVDRPHLGEWLAATPRASWQILMRGGGRRRALTAPRSVSAALHGTAAGLWIATAGRTRR